MANLFTSMMLQLHSQAAQQVSMQRELASVKQKLEQASKILRQKEQLIGSLELDLEHMIDQLVKINYTGGQHCSNKQWIARPVPGFNQAINTQVNA